MIRKIKGGVTKYMIEKDDVQERKVSMKREKLKKRNWEKMNKKDSD